MGTDMICPLSLMDTAICECSKCRPRNEPPLSPSLPLVCPKHPTALAVKMTDGAQLILPVTETARRRSLHRTKRHWLTPPELYARLDAEFHFDFDPCPYPCPTSYDGTAVEWGRCNYVNPPFRAQDGSPTAFARKAIQEAKLGKTSVLLLPVQSYVMLLVAAGAEIRSMGRVRWLEVESKEPMKGPSPICAFVLRPNH